MILGHMRAAYPGSYSEARLREQDEERSRRLDEQCARETWEREEGYCRRGHDKQGKRNCPACKREARQRAKREQ